MSSTGKKTQITSFLHYRRVSQIRSRKYSPFFGNMRR